VQETRLARAARRCWVAAQRAGVGLTRSARFAKTCTDDESVRADRRLRADDESIRTQATIFERNLFLKLK